MLCLKHVEFKVHIFQSHVCIHDTKVKYMTKSVLRLCVECNRNSMFVGLFYLFVMVKPYMYIL